MTKWTASHVPDQSGRTVLVTGANSGLGLRSAQVLAGRGATVLLGCRSPARGRDALAEVRSHATGGEPELVELDLADLSSVRKAAANVRERTGDALDILMNNAGVMATPHRRTADDFELQIGTNHLGHAALTWLLMPALTSRAGARVVTLSSIAHRGNGLDTEDLNFSRRRYNPGSAYAQSKLANLLFAFELDRRARAAGLDLTSVAAHPGMTDTELATNSARMRATAVSKVVGAVNKLITQTVERGILPQLYAATEPYVRGGEYFGPDGVGGIRGHPTRNSTTRAARNDALARRLWEATGELTGVAPDPS